MLLTAYWLGVVVLVVTLVGVAAALATPRGRLPLALRGIRRILRRDAGDLSAEPPAPATSTGRRLLAFALALLALLLCCAAQFGASLVHG